jgi:hypothetical protein
MFRPLAAPIPLRTVRGLGSRACSLSPTHTSILAFFAMANETAEINRSMLCVEEVTKLSRLQGREQAQQHGLSDSPPMICIIRFVVFFFFFRFSPFSSKIWPYRCSCRLHNMVLLFAFDRTCLPHLIPHIRNT